jgi:hypothetical protein
MNGAIVVYVVYVALAIALISWLGVLLHRDGRIFLDDVFRSQTDLAAAVSRLLVTGFLVFTLGYALLLLRIDVGASPIVALRTSVQQFGLLLLSLGAMHSLNMLILLQVRRRAVSRRAAARSSGAGRRGRVTGR